jgi:alpha-1,2-mannosyltransferase
MIVLGLAILGTGVLAWFLAPLYRIDLDVYLLGAEQWLGGGDLYGLLPATEIGHLPFTYPPFAAVVFAPFTLVPYPVAGFVWTLLSIAALVLVLVVVSRSLEVRPTFVRFAALLPVALLLEPVRATLCYGQVNLLLMALVVLDCLVRHPRWPRGVLVGVAAAVKLTPAAFVLFFLLRGDRRAAVTALVSFLGATAVGFVLNPSGSLRYWTSLVFDPDRIGGADAPSNQSVSGFLARLGVERGLLWLVLAAVVVTVGAMAVRQAARPVDALWLNAFVVLLASPVSWSHHWVWVVPALLAARPALAVGGAVLFMMAPQWWLTPTLGNAYVWCAVGVLVWWSAHRQLGRTRVHVDHRAVA